ncbi:hypothetical protein M0R45_034248 [Rubus argutus]|uniref:Transmembrane protein n=1 Tax=Rubus argutus TaxID=59490 RepID=A0AAW1VRE1_RUBAR
MAKRYQVLRAQAGNLSLTPTAMQYGSRLATVSASSSSSTDSPYNNLAFIVPVLITFVQIKFPEANDKCRSVFESHHATTMAAIASLLVYWLALEAMQEFPTYALYLQVRMFSGSLSLASLLTLLLPDSWEHMPYYALLLLYWVSRGLGCLRMMYGWAYRRVLEKLLRKLWLFTHHRQQVRRTRTLLPLSVMDMHHRIL